MSTNRILHQSEAVYLSQNPPTGSQASGTISQLYGVQSLGFDFNASLVDVNEFGSVGPVDIIQGSPTKVTFNTTYLLRNTRNESGIGLYVGGDLPIYKDILTGLYKEKNIYIGEAGNNAEIVGLTGDYGCIGIGNCFLNSYSAEGRVGSFPTASISYEGLNINFSTTRFNFDNPGLSGINGLPLGTFASIPDAGTGAAGSPTVLKSNDITVSLGGAGFGFTNVAAQSFQISAPLNVTEQDALGDQIGVREFTSPFKVTANFDFIRKDLGTGNLYNLRCNNGPYTLVVSIAKPICSAGAGQTQIQYTLKNAKLSSQNFAQQIGQGGTVNLAFEATAGASSTTKGLFISGSLV